MVGLAAIACGAAAPAGESRHAQATNSGADRIAGASAKPGRIYVTVNDLRNARGVVRACMTGNAQAFPKCGDAAGARSTVVNARTGTVTLMFDNVPPGRYAIALLHDENGNNKADRAMGMMPKEGFGFSRDAKVRMGPPRFDDAVFEVDQGDRRLAIHMRYMF